MQMSDDEKLMLFLIWWHCDWLGVEMERLTEDYFNHFFNGNEFQRFLSEANEAKEEFEFWVSDFDLEDIKESTIQNTPMLCNHRDHYFKNRIKITIGD